MPRARLALATALAACVGVVVYVMASRVDETARFVTWPIVGVAALAAVVAGYGIERGVARPLVTVAWLVPAAPLSYVSAAAPVPVIGIGLVVVASIAWRGGVETAGLAAWTGLFVTMLLLLPGPAVRCGRSGVSTGGPWWMHASTSTGSSNGAGTAVTGDFTVGDHQYAFTCRDARLVDFHRVDAPEGGAT